MLTFRVQGLTVNNVRVFPGSQRFWLTFLSPIRVRFQWPCHATPTEHALRVLSNRLWRVFIRIPRTPEVPVLWTTRQCRTGHPITGYSEWISHAVIRPLQGLPATYRLELSLLQHTEVNYFRRD